MRKLLLAGISAAALFAAQGVAHAAGQQAGQQAGYGQQAAAGGQQQAQKQSVPMQASPGSVLMIQQFLQQQGHYDGSLDGLWGPSTQEAVRRFQQQAGVEPDGHLSFQTLAAMGADVQQLAQAQQPQQAAIDQPAGQPAAQQVPDQDVGLQISGDSVAMIQQVLQQQGHYQAEIDGLWGPQTEQAIRQFQDKQGIEADGQLGFETLAALNLDLQQLAAADAGELQQGQPQVPQGQPQAVPQDQQQPGAASPPPGQPQDIPPAPPSQQ